MPSDYKRHANDEDDQGHTQGLGLAWLSVPFLLASVLIPSFFATQQMSFLRRTGQDLHIVGAAVCAIGAVIGAVAFLRMVRRKHAGGNYKAAAAATLAATVIFIVGAVVISSTDNDRAPRVGGVSAAAPQ